MTDIFGSFTPAFTQSLDEIRLAPRTAKYGNSQDEAEAIFEADQRVYRAVSLHEKRLIAQAEATVQNANAIFRRVDALVGDIWEVRGEMQRVGVRSTAELAARYETLRRRAERELRALDAVEHTAEFQAERAADPYGSLDRLRKKYPAIAGVAVR
jgi:hypothetical protein